jgi:teichoic acid transport system permease protein
MTTPEEPTITRIYDAERKLPPVWPYIVETASHLQFAYQKARLDLRAAHQDTWFGRLWNVLNPLLLGVVYWLLVIVIFGDGGSILNRESLKTLTQILGGLFLFRLPSSSLSLGAKSIVGGGTFVLNTRLPRMLLPIGSVMSAILGLSSSLLVYAVFHLAAGYPIGFQLLWAIPIILILTIITLGLAMFLATLNVYFRDVASFLPYATRIWLYLTPIIYLYEDIPSRLSWALTVNPIGTLFAAWQQVLFEGRSPDFYFIAISIVWAVAVLIVGGLMFMRRERDFAVRI